LRGGCIFLPKDISELRRAFFVLHAERGNSAGRRTLAPISSAADEEENKKGASEGVPVEPAKPNTNRMACR
jgi:hypothetical protein